MIWLHIDIIRVLRFISSPPHSRYRFNHPAQQCIFPPIPLVKVSVPVLCFCFHVGELSSTLTFHINLQVYFGWLSLIHNINWNCTSLLSSACQLLRRKLTSWLEERRLRRPFVVLQQSASEGNREGRSFTWKCHRLLPWHWFRSRGIEIDNLRAGSFLHQLCLSVFSPTARV